MKKSIFICFMFLLTVSSLSGQHVSLVDTLLTTSSGKVMETISIDGITTGVNDTIVSFDFWIKFDPAFISSIDSVALGDVVQSWGPGNLSWNIVNDTLKIGAAGGADSIRTNGSLVKIYLTMQANLSLGATTQLTFDPFWRFLNDDNTSFTFNDGVIKISNNPPAIVGTRFADQNVTEDQATVSVGTIAPIFNDPDGDPLTFSAEPSDTLAATVTIDAAGDKELSFTLKPNWDQNFVIYYSADDGQGGVTQDSFTVVVTPVNDAPVIASQIPGQTTSEDVNRTISNIEGYFSDPDFGTTLTYSWAITGGTSGLVTNIEFTNTTPKDALITVAPDAYGSATVEIRASDGSATVANPFTLTVNEVNDAPTISAVSNQTFTVGSTITIPLQAIDMDLKNVPTEALTFTWDAGISPPSWFPSPAATSKSNEYQYGSINGTAEQTTSFTARVRVTDNGGAFAVTGNFVITIEAAPLNITTTTPLPQATLGSSYSYTLAATGGETPYTWSITSGALPPGLTLDSATGEINGTPSAEGVYDFTVE